MERPHPYDTILVPLDGSEQSTLALKFARFIPCRRIQLLKVEPNFQILAPGPLSEFRPDWKEIRTQQVKEELAAVAQEHVTGNVEVDLVVRYGDPVKEIINQPDANLIIMATHGHGTASRALFGSTADSVIRHGRTPTILVRTGARAVTPAQPTRVSVSLSGEPLAEEALPDAIRLAHNLNVPLRLIRVVNVETVLQEVGVERSVYEVSSVEEAAFSEAHGTAEREADAYLTAVVKRIEGSGIPITTEVRTGTPVFEILDALTPSDILVMTTRGYGGLRRLILGSVAERLVREAPSPIMIARSTGTPRP
jgi:nucleotide-binding universal stress UspA family protein